MWRELLLVDWDWGGEASPRVCCCQRRQFGCSVDYWGALDNDRSVEGYVVLLDDSSGLSLGSHHISHVLCPQLDESLTAAFLTQRIFLFAFSSFFFVLGARRRVSLGNSIKERRPTESCEKSIRHTTNEGGELGARQTTTTRRGGGQNE